MNSVCGSCLRQIEQPHLYFASQTTKVLCGNHTNISTLKMNIEDLDSSITKLQNFFNEFTARVLEVIEGYKLQVFKTYISLEKAAYLVNNINQTQAQLKQSVNQLEFPLGSYEMKILFTNPIEKIARHLSFEISSMVKSNYMQVQSTKKSLCDLNDSQLKTSKQTTDTVNSSTRIDNPEHGLVTKESNCGFSPIKQTKSMIVTT